jgi:hypothetical protein
MKSRWAIFTILTAVFWLLSAGSSSQAVGTKDIENVGNKSVLDSSDFKTIDNFVAAAVHELVRTKDLSSIAKLRTVIVRHNHSSKPSAKAQYAGQFYESAYKHISAAFEDAAELPTEERRFVVTVNLLILVDKLLADATQNLQLAELGIRMLRDDNMVIRYWAVHSVTSADFARKLNSLNPEGAELAGRIAQELRELIETSSPEVLALMAEFAAEADVSQTEELILQIADMRIRAYENWAVEYELLDADILKSLCKKISRGGRNKPALAQRFAQLYSYAIQRYIKGQNHLTDTQRHQLASVLVETEDKCIRELLGYQADIKNAVGQEDYGALMSEHDELLGQLARKYRYTYEDRNGNARPLPEALPEPPTTES